MDFVRNIIERRALNAPRNHDFFSYDTYDQKIFAKNDFDETEERGKKRYRRIDFIFDYIDTSRVSGKPILPLYNEERIEHTYFRRSPHAERRVVQGVKRAGLVELFSEDGITQFIDEVFREPDVFQDNIPLFLQRFVSPLASFGPTFYKYYLTDTVEIDGERCADLSFVPFNKKRNFRKEFPFHYLRAEYRYDINQIGQHYLYTNPDNIFMMLKRRRNDLITYMQKAELSYYHERYNGLGYGITLRHLTEWGTRYVPFLRFESDGTTSPVSHYLSAQMEVSIRWAPNEKFYQSRNYRYPITLDAPIITLTHTFARRGLLGTDHNYNRTELGIRKRFWLSPFGYIDIYGQAGAVWDRVPYPLLIIPNANLSYSIEPESYALMDPMEFIHDRFASWEATYFLNGALLNRLPLLKRLQLREVFAFRGWYGSLTEKNNPWQPDNADLYAFPTNTYLMGSRPYMELNCGLDNIFKLVRVDYVWRLSYRNHPHMPNSGLRLKVQFSF